MWVEVYALFATGAALGCASAWYLATRRAAEAEDRAWVLRTCVQVLREELDRCRR